MTGTRAEAKIEVQIFIGSIVLQCSVLLPTRFRSVTWLLQRLGPGTFIDLSIHL